MVFDLITYLITITIVTAIIALIYQSWVASIYLGKLRWSAIFLILAIITIIGGEIVNLLYVFGYPLPFNGMIIYRLSQTLEVIFILISAICVKVALRGVTDSLKKRGK